MQQAPPNCNIILGHTNERCCYNYIGSISVNGTRGVVLPIQYHELNSGLMGVYRDWWDIGIEGKGGVKRKGSRF